jgi:hypothetical protein
VVLIALEIAYLRECGLGNEAHPLWTEAMRTWEIFNTATN